MEGGIAGDMSPAPLPALPKVAVFLDGCFWHACPKHGVKPRTNEGYWAAKNFAASASMMYPVEYSLRDGVSAFGEIIG